MLILLNIKTKQISVEFLTFNRSLGFQKLQKTEDNESITWRKRGASSTLDRGDDVSAITLAHYDIRINQHQCINKRFNNNVFFNNFFY